MPGTWAGSGSGNGLAVVEHGADATTARPDTTDPVLWIGSVDPTNALEGDFVVRTDEDVDSGTSPLTTKGDLYAHDGTDDVRLPVGADGEVLVADSSQASGLGWAAAPASGTGRWEVVVSGIPAEAVTNEAGDDWLYAWIED